jgi:hypothetical protein
MPEVPLPIPVKPAFGKKLVIKKESTHKSVTEEKNITVYQTLESGLKIEMGLY